ncbi:hypothetical protein D9615_000283 [Tricholomella constricta]|uniref:Uncharacterized protein n=1 Tax=Tricholomella constricta TaxID=117010 RepID=A0A8H5HS89_9AGAR|nr:hypothetical protein D9615_000283 [Tricholomella constricta]
MSLRRLSNTKSAPPLPSPPSHLLINPRILTSLHAMDSHVKVDTPFDVNKLKSMLHDHPNQPFIKSVMNGLRHRFWPFDEGEWKSEEEEFAGNYAIKDCDLNTICEFRDKELKASWQNLAGHLNWLLNVLPWGWPALTELYRKMSGKSLSSRGIPLNAAIVADLSWLKGVIPAAIGVHFIDEGLWWVDEADMVVWTDASTSKGLGFVYSNRGFCYGLEPCPPSVQIDIFFLELVAILLAIHHVATLASPPRQLPVWTDSLNSVEALNALHIAEFLHNGPLLAITGIALCTNINI